VPRPGWLPPRGARSRPAVAARLSVDHATPREQVALLGETLAWHGGLTLDYFHEGGSPQYIECNPRTVEPGNAAASGVNIPELQIRVTLAQEVHPAPRVGRPDVCTHGTMALLLGSASRGRSRRSLLGEVCAAITHRGLYRHSAEQLTPLWRDPKSLAPAAFVATRLLASPRRAQDIAAQAVAGYAVDPRTLGALTMVEVAGSGARGTRGPAKSTRSVGGGLPTGPGVT
jgi:hypothetical protein